MEGLSLLNQRSFPPDLLALGNLKYSASTISLPRSPELFFFSLYIIGFQQQAGMLESPRLITSFLTFFQRAPYSTKCPIPFHSKTRKICLYSMLNVSSHSIVFSSHFIRSLRLSPHRNCPCPGRQWCPYCPTQCSNHSPETGIPNRQTLGQTRWCLTENLNTSKSVFPKICSYSIIFRFSKWHHHSYICAHQNPKDHPSFLSSGHI